MGRSSPYQHDVQVQVQYKYRYKYTLYCTSSYCMVVLVATSRHINTLLLVLLLVVHVLESILVLVLGDSQPQDVVATRGGRVAVVQARGMVFRLYASTVQVLFGISPISPDHSLLYSTHTVRVVEYEYSIYNGESFRD
jgi:hypothetical protein